MELHALGRGQLRDIGSSRSRSHQSVQSHQSQKPRWPMTRGSGRINPDGRPQESTKTSLQQRLSGRARKRWPQLAGVDVKFKGSFAYVAGCPPMKHCLDATAVRRLRGLLGICDLPGQQRTATSPQPYPKAKMAGLPEDALDCACGFYIGDPTAACPKSWNFAASNRLHASQPTRHRRDEFTPLDKHRSVRRPTAPVLPKGHRSIEVERCRHRSCCERSDLPPEKDAGMEKSGRGIQ